MLSCCHSKRVKRKADLSSEATIHHHCNIMPENSSDPIVTRYSDAVSINHCCSNPEETQENGSILSILPSSPTELPTDPRPQSEQGSPLLHSPPSSRKLFSILPSSLSDSFHQDDDSDKMTLLSPEEYSLSPPPSVPSILPGQHSKTTHSILPIPRIPVSAFPSQENDLTDEELAAKLIPTSLPTSSIIRSTKNDQKKTCNSLHSAPSMEYIQAPPF